MSCLSFCPNWLCPVVELVRLGGQRLSFRHQLSTHIRLLQGLESWYASEQDGVSK